MLEHSKTRIAIIAALLLAAIYSPIALATAQVTRTSTVTQTTSVYSTSIQVTTFTNQTTAYTTTTQIITSTLQGTQTQFLPSVTTATSTLTYEAGGTVTATSSITLTTVSTQIIQILGNIWGESLAVVVFAGAIASYLVPKAGSRRPKGVVCRNCGNVNPPFANAFCVKCGHSLKESS